MSYTKEQRIVNQSKPKKVKVEATPVGSIGGSPLIIPNHSGDHDAGRILKTPVIDTNIVNKKYVDDSFPVTHASTTGQTTDDHHAQSHSHVSHTGIGASDHHAKTTSGEIDHNATINTHNLTTDISHDSISDVSADDHHAETHTIVSHDTSATGAELDTLTDNSIADTLHRHSELVASDGSPDPALSVDATGNVGIGTTSPDAVGDVTGLAGTNFKVNASANQARIIMEGATSADLHMADMGGSANARQFRLRANSDKLTFASATDNFETVTDTLTIDHAGKVGIGTTSPGQKLEVAGNYLGTPAQSASNYFEIHPSGDTNHIMAINSPSSKWETTGDTVNYEFPDANHVFQAEWSGNWKMFSADPIDIKTRDAEAITFIVNSGTLGGAGTEALKIQGDGDIEIMNGNVGIGTTSPTQPLSVNEKVCMTAIGGIAIKLTNNTRGDTIKGQTVRANTAANDSVIPTDANDDECIGVFLESGVADRAEAWVVIAGIADVLMGDNEATTAGNWVETNSTEAGYADGTAASPAAAPQHFNEIGHCIETVAAGGAGTHILARCVLHFN